MGYYMGMVVYVGEGQEFNRDRELVQEYLDMDFNDVEISVENGCTVHVVHNVDDDPDPVDEFLEFQKDKGIRCVVWANNVERPSTGGDYMFACNADIRVKVHTGDKGRPVAEVNATILTPGGCLVNEWDLQNISEFFGLVPQCLGISAFRFFNKEG